MLYNTLNSLVETPEQEWIPKTIRVTLNTRPHALHFHNEVIHPACLVLTRRFNKHRSTNNKKRDPWLSLLTED